MKKIVLGLYIVFIAIALVGCFETPTPTPAPKGDTLPPEDIDTYYNQAMIIAGNVMQGVSMGPLPDIPVPASLSTSGSNSLNFSSKQLFTAQALSSWTGPDSDGWYQATDSDTDPGSGNVINTVVKFRYFSSTNVYEINRTDTSTQTGATSSDTFHITKGNNNLWSGTIQSDAPNEKKKVEFSNAVDNDYTGIFDAWTQINDPETNVVVNYHQYAHYILVYDPDNPDAPPGSPYHLTGWWESASYTLDGWVEPPLTM